MGRLGIAAMEEGAGLRIKDGSRLMVGREALLTVVDGSEG